MKLTSTYNRNKFKNIPKILVLLLLLSINKYTHCQIEVAHATVKDFKKTGFGGFLNFSAPVNDANYLTIETGLQYFKNEYDEELALIPTSLGYLYTFNHSGAGFYVEPKLGYTFGSSTIGIYEEPGTPIAGENGEWAHEKVSGPMTGIGFGYLLEPDKFQLNISVRYEHTFAKAPVNVFALRLTHAFYFWKRTY